MFEDLKKNLEQEKKIVADMHSIQIGMQNDVSNQSFYISSLNALAKQLMLLNNAVPELLKEESPIKKFIDKSNKTTAPVTNSKIIRMSYVSPVTKEKKYITINKEDKKEFLKKLELSEGALAGMKKMKEKDTRVIISKPSSYARISNKFFRNYSDKLVPQFEDLSKDIKKANIRFLLSSYLSMAIMSTIIAFVAGLLIFIVLLIFSLNNWMYFVLPFGLSGLTLAAFYLYPASEANSVQKKISQELPFATIHMAAIAGSNIEPTKIFKIIAMSKEYLNIGKEIRKVIVQVDVYGYDLVTSLKNVALRTSNKKLSELFSGLATNISTGGALKNYLEKKSENFLVDYKLERNEYAALAGTFMDVYISILIAAPLVLMMMFIVMNAAGLGMAGLSITTLLTLSIIAIIIVNIIFLIVLNMKQPQV
ncbi:MAG: type II secretion system F family protein [archaeon]